jgi:excisionase family DNA binding protein
MMEENLQIKKYLNVAEAAELAGVKVKTIYKWIELRTLPPEVIAKPPGTRRLRFKLDAFQAWLDTSPSWEQSRNLR